MTVSLPQQRRLISALFDMHSPSDAPTAYYALYHDQKRSHLAVKAAADGSALGVAGRFQTGLDLFRPVVALRCPNGEIAADLLAQILVVGRPYILFSNLNQLALTGGSLQISNERILSIYVLNPAHFKSEMNILVRHSAAQDGTPRAEIESNGVRAVSGVNWQSPGFAEIYVQVDAEARQKGWGRSVVTAVSERVLKGGRLPIYLVERSNEASLRLAEGLGYQDTGSRQIYADAVYLGHPASDEQST